LNRNGWLTFIGIYSIDLWDENKQLPKRKHPEFKELKMLIDSKIDKANKALYSLEIHNDDFSVSEIKAKVQRKTKAVSVFNYLQEHYKKLISIGKTGNAEIYQDFYRVLRNFLKEKSLSFNEVNVELLKQLELHFQQKGLKPNTMNLYFRTFRAIINYAVQDGIVVKERNPFLNYSFSHLKNETLKRALTKADIKKIEGIEVESGSKEEFAKDFFMFSYYTYGMNFKDVAFLKWENVQIQEGKYHLFYIRSKTKKLLTITLNPNAIMCLEKYRNKDLKNYIFPILDLNLHIKPTTIQNRLKKVRGEVNKNLKVLGEKVGLTEPLSTYYVRHTFASVMKRNGTSISKISDMMGHKSEAITQVYLDSFGNDELYEASLGL
jgi:site-specific recombinase XerD